MEIVRYRDEFYPVGFRKLFALMLVSSVTVLPAVASWADTPVESATESRLPTGRFRPRGGFLRETEKPQPGVVSTLWGIVKRCFQVTVATLGVMLYYPRSGFKRYALLCGPFIAFFVPFVVGLYLRGRSEVFRAEIVVVALLALAPGVALYVLLTSRKARRMGIPW
ncbi:MAG: hypothetical protein AB7F89_08390 [Pirellulaceae bacterium]